jgi:uncharacterized membrane protein
MKAHADGETDAGFVFGSGVVMFALWIAGTLLGSLAGNWIAQPKVLALDFLLIAFCMAMAVDMLKSCAALWPAAAALASFACRAGGFWLMRFVNVTPRVQAALAAAPLAVMIGIVAPVAAKGSLPEIAGVMVTAVVMRATGRDLLAALAGVAVVAAGRLLHP